MPLNNTRGQAPTPIPSAGGKSGGGMLDAVLNAVDPSGIRLKVAGLFSGGANSVDKSTQMLGQNQNWSWFSTEVANEQDWRVRISWPDAIVNQLGNPLFAPLQKTDGVIFPYTPAISVTHNARYSEQALTHSNYKNYFYEGSDVASISITGDFTVQTLEEGQYLLACIYFFRSSTKMFVGNDALQGNPPPLVYLNGYGDYYFPNVSCVITSFQHTMPADVDYVDIPFSNNPTEVVSTSTGKSVRLPTSSQLTVTLQPVYSRTNMFNNFTLTDFAAGKMLKGNGGFI